MKISDILTRDPVVISPSANARDAAKLMRDHDIGILPVCEGQRVLGTVTDRDLAIRLIAEGREPEKTRIKEVMTEGAAYCFEDDDLEHAARIMEQKQIRRLPVLNSGKRLVGIVSLGDLAVRSEEDELTEEVLECVSRHS